MSTALKLSREEALALHRRAHEAGLAAGEAAKPRVVVWGSPSTPLGSDVDPEKPIYVDAEGVCGFACVKVPGNTSLARHLREAGLARSSATGGTVIWCREFGQSYERKTAYAHAYAEVLREAGIKRAFADGRLD